MHDENIHRAQKFQYTVADPGLPFRGQVLNRTIGTVLEPLRSSVQSPGMYLR